MDFSRLGSAQRFEELCQQILYVLYPTLDKDTNKVRTIDGAGGDRGTDSFIGTIDNQDHIFQFKWFTESLKAHHWKKIKLSLQKASETNPSRWTLLVATEFKQSDWQKWKELREQYPGIALEVLTKSAMERVILDNRDSLALEFIELFPAGEVAMSYFRLQKSMSKPLITPEQTDPPIITRYENADLKLINDNELRRIRRDAEKFTQLFHGIGSSISIQERNVKFLSKLAYYYLHNGNYDEACFILGLILREYPDDVRSLNNMAVALFESSKIDASLELLEKAIQIFPDYLDALINKAVFLAESEVNPKEGMRILESLLEKPEYEKNESILKGLVKGYSVLADLPKTLVYFGKAKDANIEEESVYSDVGGAYFRNGNADLALDYFERALDKNPSSIDVLINKTTALIELGLLISAQVILERLQKQKPLNPLLITNLATVYSKQHKDDLAFLGEK